VEIVQPVEEPPQIVQAREEKELIDRLLKNALNSHPRSEQRVRQLLDTIDEYSPEEKLISAAILHSRDRFLEILKRHPVELKDAGEPQEGGKNSNEFFKELLFTVMTPELPRLEACNTMVLNQKIAEIETQLRNEVLG